MKLQEATRCFLRKQILFDGFTFVWFTDGIGWKSARGNLRETFEVMEHVYNLNDIENNIIKRITI